MLESLYVSQITHFFYTSVWRSLVVEYDGSYLNACPHDFFLIQIWGVSSVRAMRTHLGGAVVSEDLRPRVTNSKWPKGYDANSRRARPSVIESKFLKRMASLAFIPSRKYHRCFGLYLS